jgi:hypothetical protein
MKKRIDLLVTVLKMMALMRFFWRSGVRQDYLCANPGGQEPQGQCQGQAL